MLARLVTIPISHFCEKARRALDRASVPYREEAHLQGIHVAAARLAGGGRTVPVLVTPAREVVAESAAIVRWADAGLYAPPEAAALEAWLDTGLGPDDRLWMYHHTLPAVRELAPWALAGVPGWERVAFAVGGRLGRAGAAPLPGRVRADRRGRARSRGRRVRRRRGAAGPRPREVGRLRAHPAGRYGLRLYETERWA